MKDKIMVWEVIFIVQMVNKKTHYKYIYVTCYVYIYMLI